MDDLIIHSIEVVVLHLVVIPLVAFTLTFTLWLAFHVAEIPRKGEVDRSALPPVFLMSCESITVGVVLPFTRVEYVATVDGKREHLVEEILPHAKIHTIVRLAVSL